MNMTVTRGTITHVCKDEAEKQIYLADGYVEKAEKAVKAEAEAEAPAAKKKTTKK